jgi:hypothetical protein
MIESSRLDQAGQHQISNHSEKFIRDEERLGISLPWLLALFCPFARSEANRLYDTQFAGYATSSSLPDSFYIIPGY